MVINWVFAILLALSLIVPYLPPSRFHNVSLVSLIVAPLMLVNLLFVLWWTFVRIRRVWLSLVVLLLALLQFGTLFAFGAEQPLADSRSELKLTSFNVRLFNAYEPKPDKQEVSRVMQKLLARGPDLLCLQEYYREHVDLQSFPYRFEHFRGKNNLGHAILSRYPIKATGAFDFKDTGNNVIYADIEVDGQYIRVYNLHLQSIGISANMDYLQQSDSQVLRHRLARAFVRQQEQLEEVLRHAGVSPYPVILAGDFNNTPFSYIYREAAGKYQDAFNQAGSGVGITFWFEFVPMRIDYIFSSTFFQVLEFNTLNDSFSDHLPIEARLGWPVK
jgi:endonuclease/exonuclease/phosphatase family metal-dependent hydrolase